jgi:predicted nucleic acid-binding protein
MYLLDTNVVSDLRKAKTGGAEPRLIAWAVGVPAHDLYLSVISILELEIGILRMERKDATQGALLRNWMDTQVIPGFANRVIPVDEVIARCCAQLHVPDPKSERDALLAATAVIHGLTIVTRNTSDFESTGVTIVNPWVSGNPQS